MCALLSLSLFLKNESLHEFISIVLVIVTSHFLLMPFFVYLDYTVPVRVFRHTVILSFQKEH